MPTTTTYTPTEIIFQGPKPQAIPVTIVSGLNLAKGTVLGRVTATGKYAAYNDANSNGTEVASGILAEAINTSSSGFNSDMESAMYIEGVFTEANLVGLDANAKTDLNGRTIPGRGIFKF